MPSNLSVWSQKAASLGVDRTIAVSALEQKVSEIFVELRDPVYRYVLGLAGDPHEAEDLTQEAFLRLFADLRKGQPVDNVRAWVFRVAHNLVIDRARHRGNVQGVAGEGSEAEQEDPSPTVEQAMLDRERRGRIALALGRLSPQERNCVRLRSQGLRYREIAEVLSIRIPTVQTLLGRAVKKIVSEFK